jgi:hypothetical protein
MASCLELDVGAFFLQLGAGSRHAVDGCVDLGFVL